MKVLLAIFAVALPPFTEPVGGVCMSTKGDPCLSKAEVYGFCIALFIIIDRFYQSPLFRQPRSDSGDTTLTEARVLSTPLQKEKG